jgi:hypothetical protein
MPVVFSRGYKVTVTIESNPTPTHNNQLTLPSGIKILSIELWSEKLVTMTKSQQYLYRIT